MNRGYLIVVVVLAVGLAGMLGAGWHFLVLPLRADYADTMAQKQDIELQLQTARATAAQFVKFKTQTEQLKRNLEFYESRTGVDLQPVELTEQMESLGNVYGLDEVQVALIQAQGQAASSSSPGMGQAHLDLHFDADFKRVGEFLNACVSQKRIIVPTHISLANYTDATGLYQDTLTVGMDLMAYGAQAPAGVH